MFVSSQKLVDDEDIYKFPAAVRIMHYVYSETLFNGPVIRFYICVNNGERYLYNKYGDPLYSLGNMHPEAVLKLIEDKGMYNYKQYPPKQHRHCEKQPLRGEDWGAECIRQYGGSIILYLIGHPKRTYQDCVSMMTNEGYKVTASGFVEKQSE